MTDLANTGSVPAILGGEPMLSVGIPVSQPTLPLFGEVEEQFRDIFSTGMITTSKYVDQFEGEMAAYLGVKEAVAVSSNTTGLLLLFKCLGLSGEVILPSFTFSASGHALDWNNLKPVYVDIDLETCVIDPDKVEAAITSETCAIFGVHLWGNPCAADRLQEIADRHGIPLLFDAAQAVGSLYGDRKVGSFGLAEVFSCSPTKMMTSAEGGIVSTNDVDLAAKIRLGRNYGVDAEYDCEFAGINARPSELHAVLGLASLGKLDGDIERRMVLMERYRVGLEDLPGVSFQRLTQGGRTNGVYFSIRIDEKVAPITRDQLSRALEAENVQTRKYYMPLHWQKVYLEEGREFVENLEATEQAARNYLTLPLFSHMTESQVDTVCSAIGRIFHYGEKVAAA
jgi:dTDP-4-amino-4,6-dideoxygalactose transaminase